MAELTSTNDDRTKKRWLPVLMSVISHLMLLSLGLLTLANMPRTTGSEADRAGEIVLAVLDENQEKSYLQKSDAVAEPKIPPTAPAIASDPPPAIDFQIDMQKKLTGPAPIEFNERASDLTGNTIGRNSETPYELSEEDLKLIEADQKLVRNRKPKGSETTISVFGSGDLTGRRFVFLIDRSKSMGEQGLGVLKQARIELSKAIDTLENHHFFQIVVYHNSTGTIGKRELLPATTENKQRVPNFLQSLLAFGGTNHERGLYSAITYRPDVIVMMTDGGSPDLNDGQLKAIKKSARNTQIHTIQFGLGTARDTNHFLERLSQITAGTYRYIDVRNWRKK